MNINISSVFDIIIGIMFVIVLIILAIGTIYFDAVNGYNKTDADVMIVGKALLYDSIKASFTFSLFLRCSI